MQKFSVIVLNDEWGKLQLEQATWSLHSLIAFEARHKAGHGAPRSRRTPSFCDLRVQDEPIASKSCRNSTPGDTGSALQ